MKTLSILGSIGSIGTQALKVMRELDRTGRTQFSVAVLAAHHNVELLEQQVREFSPRLWRCMTRPQRQIYAYACGIWT